MRFKRKTKANEIAKPRSRHDSVASTLGNRKLQQLHRQSQTRRLFKIQPCMRITRSCSRCTRIIILPESCAKGLEAKILIVRCCYTRKEFFFSSGQYEMFFSSNQYCGIFVA